MHVHAEYNSQLHVSFLKVYTSCCSESGCLICLELADRARLTGQQAPENFLSLPPAQNTDYKFLLPHATFYMGPGNFRSSCLCGKSLAN